MTILLTGGTGKTAIRIAKLLHERNVPVLLASRKGQAGVPSPFKGVAFDWDDKSTYANPFTADTSIDRVYLIAPPRLIDSLPLCKEFITLAREKGVKRFVFLSGTPAEKGGPAHGQVHEYLADLGVEYAVLRPSWFFENFSETLVPSIRDNDVLVTTAGDGKIGFISSEDIAEIAVKALTDEKSHNTEHIIVGPELLSYDEIVEQFSQVLGRKIIHKKVSAEERKAQYISFGLPEEYATMMSSVEAAIAQGSEEKIYARPGNVIGKVYFKDFAEANKQLWIKQK